MIASKASKTNASVASSQKIFVLNQNHNKFICSIHKNNVCIHIKLYESTTTLFLWHWTRVDRVNQGFCHSQKWNMKRLCPKFLLNLANFCWLPPPFDAQCQNLSMTSSSPPISQNCWSLLINHGYCHVYKC